jgi:hypothetical protein
METVNSQEPAKSRSASNSRRNNPFFQNGPDLPISPVDSATYGNQEDAQMEQAPSYTTNPDEKSFKSATPKPGILSTLLNFGLNTAPDRSSEVGNYHVEKDWKRASVSGASIKALANIPLPSMPVQILSMKARRPSAIIRNVTGYIHFPRSLSFFN